MSLINDSLIETLIEEVEKRPALYNKSLKEYSDINLKKNLWEEVCQIVVPEWSELDREEKREQGHETQKKWANLRTCFRRELNAQKNTKSGRAATKRRKYIYFDKLSFLLPCVENLPTEGNLALRRDQEEEEEEEHGDDDDDDDDNESLTASSIRILRRKNNNNNKSNTAVKDVDEELSKALRGTQDEDTHFALSIVPSLQSLTAEEKLDAKIGILNVFKEIRKARRCQSTTQAPYTKRE